MSCLGVVGIFGGRAGERRGKGGRRALVVEGGGKGRRGREGRGGNGRLKGGKGRGRPGEGMGRPGPRWGFDEGRRGGEGRRGRGRGKRIDREGMLVAGEGEGLELHHSFAFPPSSQHKG